MRIQKKLNRLLAGKLKKASASPFSDEELEEYLNEHIHFQIKQPEEGYLGKAEAVSLVVGHYFQFKYVQYMYRIEVDWDSVKEVEPYEEVITVTKYRPVKS